MLNISKTGIVYNNFSKHFGLQPFIYRKRTCDNHLTGSTPAEQYQRLKIIQNTVRVPSSLYTDSKASLSVYKRPLLVNANVNWNQMSDQPIPSTQKTTGYNPTFKGSIMPGGLSPGGVGCDIKHNSYDRYLRKLKGKGPLRRGKLHTYTADDMHRMYGGKNIKTNLISSCKCDNESDVMIYENPAWQPEPIINIALEIGQKVYAIEAGDTSYSSATILDIQDGIVTVQFENGNTQTITNTNDIKLYFKCSYNESDDQLDSYLNSYTDCDYPLNELFTL
jgi:hypothetical protein